jgi:hypothetical protein
MNVGQAKAFAREWVEMNETRWPGLRAAHLVGGITSMPDDAPFPATKDLDIHLIFAEDSPMLHNRGPFANNIEELHDGLQMEAGIRTEIEYASPEAVLANPEIAYHLTTECVLFDPEGVLAELQEPVRTDFALRRWMEARVEAERQGSDAIYGIMPMAREMAGGAGVVNIIGWSTTRLSAALHDALLLPPRVGGKMLILLRGLLADQDRLDLYEPLLATFGLDTITPGQAHRHLDEGAEAFDLAVATRTSPHPFQHKMHAHLRPYFVDSCQEMIDQGFHREALAWCTPFAIAAMQIILMDGPDAEKPRYGARLAALVDELGFGSDAACDQKIAQALNVRDQVFALARTMIATNPDIRD